MGGLPVSASPEFKFFVKFGFVCRIYFETARKRREVDPAFSNCPVECPNGRVYFDENRAQKCETCPRREIENLFKTVTEKLIFELYGASRAGLFRFSEMAGALYTLIPLLDMEKSKMSIKTEALISVYEREKYRQERIDEIEREANRPNN